MADERSIWDVIRGRHKAQGGAVTERKRTGQLAVNVDRDSELTLNGYRQGVRDALQALENLPSQARVKGCRDRITELLEGDSRS